MRLPALIHLLEATRALSHCERIVVLGSSSLLASFPHLGETGQPLEVSYDADLLLEPADESIASMLHEAVGEGSLFAGRTGYFADILRPEITETLPPGWNARLVKVGSSGENFALSTADLAVVKLSIGRSKDLELCRHLITQKLLTPAQLRERLDATPLLESEIVKTYRRLEEVCRP